MKFTFTANNVISTIWIPFQWWMLLLSKRRTNEHYEYDKGQFWLFQVLRQVRLQKRYESQDNQFFFRDVKVYVHWYG